MGTNEDKETFDKNIRKALKLSAEKKDELLKKLIRYYDSRGNNAFAEEAAKHLTDDGEDGSARLKVEEICRKVSEDPE